ncbi:MAG: hypothetical protein JSR77_04245 [Planctomycetes bacterium]|nr:hypothetical protein [Planctomycetota bacterium]
MGVVIILLCVVVSGVGLLTAVVTASRHGRRGLAGACGAALGSVLVWAWVSLYVGTAERVWTARSVAPWGLACTGAVGCALLAWGIVVMRRRVPGRYDCPRCGYDCKGVDRCPECGGGTAGR